MDYTLRPLSEEDRETVMDIFNYYAENTLSAYPEHALPLAAFDLFLQAAKTYPVVCVLDPDGRVAGFGMLRAFHPMPTFAKTAEVGYFLHPDHTGRGLGSMMLAHLSQEGRRMGLKTLMASISSENQGSCRFHQRQGFTECGRFKGVWHKKGRDLDMVWMQKDI